MTVEETKELKNELGRNIVKLVRAFEVETKCHAQIKQITLNAIDIHSPPITVDVVIKVEF